MKLSMKRSSTAISSTCFSLGSWMWRKIAHLLAPSMRAAW
jgi:hypothetical protein